MFLFFPAWTRLKQDRTKNIDDYAIEGRDLVIVEHMIEYKIKNENSVFLNAVIALQIIAGQHPFINGNKRIGIATAIMILRNEEYGLTVNDKTDFMWLWQRRRRMYRLNRLWIG